MKKALLILLTIAFGTTSFAVAAKKATKTELPRHQAALSTRANSDLSHTVIFEIPEGDTQNFSAAYEGIALNFGVESYLPTYNSGFVTNITYCDNDEVYLRDCFAILEQPLGSYVKGKRVGDKIVVPNMFCIGGFNDEDYDDEDYDDEDYYEAPSRVEDDEWTYGENGTYMYLAVTMEDPEAAAEGEVNFIVDEECTEFAFIINADGTITLSLPEGRYLSICYETSEWLGYSMSKETLTPFTAQAITELPDGLVAEKWVLSGAADARFVDVAISGNDIYLGDIDSMLPAYIKGTIDGTKVTFPSNQYIGINFLYNFYSYIVGGVYGTYTDPLTGESYEDYLRTDALTFYYDAEAKTLTGNENEGLFVNLGDADYIYYYAMYAPASIKWQDPNAEPARPKNPIITACYYDDWFEFSILDFDLPKTDINGNLLDIENMYYNFYCNEEMFTFYADEYYTLPFDGIEEMTDVPYTYSDAFNYLIIGGESTKHSLSFFFTGADSVGLKLFYKTADGEVLASDYVGYELSSVKGVESAAEVVATEYYDFSGAKIAAPIQGMYIKVETLSDGTRRTNKVIRN